MTSFSKVEAVSLLGSLITYVALTVWAVVLYNTLDQAPTWSTGVLSI